MESFFARYRNPLVLVALVLVQVIGLATQIRRPGNAETDGRDVRLIRLWVVEVVSPFERLFVGMGRGLRGGWYGYVNLRHVRQQNAQLQSDVNRLRMEQASLIEDARQGQRLQQLLAFKEHYIYQTVAAQVIGTSGSDQSHVLYLDKGSHDGLKADMPVITPDGIVGKLRDVFPHTSQVLEISDQTSGAGVMLEATRIRSVLRGNTYGQPEIINLLPDDRIKPGETVVTSGGDQIYPRGLPVGTVERVMPDPERDPYVAILVKPAANLTRLEEVLVITTMGDALPQAAQVDIATSEQDAAANKRAADVLAEKLPTVDPAKEEPAVGAAAKTADPAPAKPVATLHADRYTPGDAPPASSLTPGGGASSPGGSGVSQPAVAQSEQQGNSQSNDQPAPSNPPKAPRAGSKSKKPASGPSKNDQPVNP